MGASSWYLFVKKVSLSVFATVLLSACCLVLLPSGIAHGHDLVNPKLFHSDSAKMINGPTPKCSSVVQAVCYHYSDSAKMINGPGTDPTDAANAINAKRNQIGWENI